MRGATQQTVIAPRTNRMANASTRTPRNYLALENRVKHARARQIVASFAACAPIYEKVIPRRRVSLGCAQQRLTYATTLPIRMPIAIEFGNLERTVT